MSKIKIIYNLTKCSSRVIKIRTWVARDDLSSKSQKAVKYPECDDLATNKIERKG